MLNKIGQVLLEEQRSWVLWLPVFFGLGIALYFALPFEPSSGAAIRCITAPTILLVMTRRHFFLRALCIILLFVGMGFAVTKFKADLLNTRFISTNNQQVTISGNIVEIGYANDYPRLLLNNLRIDALGKNLPEKIRLNVRTKIRDEIKVGDRIITNAVLMNPPAPSVIGGYNYARQAYFEGIGATGYTVRQVIKLKTGADENIIKNASTAIGKRVYAVLSGDVGAIAAALINGDRSKITDGVNNDFRASGLYHILSISGLHLVLVTGIFFVSSRFLMSLSYRASEVLPIKKMAAFVALIGGLLYLLISGLQVPAERSFIMAGLILIGVIFDRTATPMRSVAFAAFIVLLFEPNALITPSFQMSFAAAAALIAMYEYISKYHPEFYKNKALAWFLGSILTSMIAGFATSPYAAYHFGRFTSYGLIANMAAAPITAFLVMPAAVLGVLLMPLGLEHLALIPMGWGIEAMMKIAEFVGGLAGATKPIPFVSNSAIILFTAGFLWLIIWQRKWRVLGVLPMLFAFILPLLQPVPDIFISENGKTYALNNHGRLEFNKTRDSFTSKSWLVYFGQMEAFDITTYNVKNCHFYGKKLELTCGGEVHQLPPNSMIFLQNNTTPKIVPMTDAKTRIWERAK